MIVHGKEDIGKAVQPEKPISQVEIALINIEEVIHELVRVHEMLEDRLSVVLQLACDLPDKIPELQDLVPLASRLQGNVTALRAQKEYVEDIISRLAM